MSKPISNSPHAERSSAYPAGDSRRATNTARWIAAAAIAGVFIGCGTQSPTPSGAGGAGGTGATGVTGGTGASAGHPAAAGGTGGSTSAGGTTASGGSTATGGTTSTGGSTSAGGTTSTGGSTATGGTTSTGGSTATGGTTSSAGTGGTGSGTGGGAGTSSAGGSGGAGTGGTTSQAGTGAGGRTTGGGAGTGGGAQAGSGSGGMSTMGGSGGSSSGSCQKGQTKPAEVVIMGESFYAIDPQYIQNRIQDDARMAGSLGANDTYRNVAVSGQNMNYIATTEWTAATQGGASVKLVIMDGGGIDCLTGGSTCSTCASTFQTLLGKMATAGVKDVIYTRYPEPGNPPGSNTSLKACLDATMPNMQTVCEGSTSPVCHWVDLRPVWVNGDTSDGLHPTQSGGDHVGDLIWSEMVKDCLAQ